MTAHCEFGQDLVATKIDELLRVDVPRAERAYEAFEVSPNGVEPGIAARLEAHRVGVPDDLRVPKLTRPRQTLLVECLEGPPHDLHVLLRHRLLLKPHGFEG